MLKLRYSSYLSRLNYVLYSETSLQQYIIFHGCTVCFCFGMAYFFFLLIFFSDFLLSLMYDMIIPRWILTFHAILSQSYITCYELAKNSILCIWCNRLEIQCDTKVSFCSVIINCASSDLNACGHCVSKKIHF